MTAENRNDNFHFSAEFPENLQMHVSRLFTGSRFLLNTSARYYQNAAFSGRAVQPGEANRFYTELMDFAYVWTPFFDWDLTESGNA